MSTKNSSSPSESSKVNSEPKPEAASAASASANIAVAGAVAEASIAPLITKGAPKPEYNALKSGVYAKECLLPGENPEEFDALLEAYRDELFPEGPSENDIVCQVVQFRWIKRRVIRALVLPHIFDPLAEEIAEASRNGHEAFATLIRGQRLDEKEADWVLSSSDASIAAKIKFALLDLDKTQTTQRPLEPTYHALIARLSGGSKDAAVQDQAVLARINRSADLEQFLKLMGTLDSRIDKAMARLVSLKEYKQRYRKVRLLDQSTQAAA